jgi:catechol 2,3-dioxygenase-like lactoylglutathione lyase family enzyme
MMIERIDHFVLTVRSLEDTCEFYTRVLGFERVDQEGSPTALRFGAQKINVHETSRTFEPKAAHPTPGAGDFCIVTTWPISAVVERLTANAVIVELGPVHRDGAQGPMTSVYFRDPDNNLVEVSRYDDRQSVFGSGAK